MYKARAEEGQHGHYPAVDLIGFRQLQLHQDAVHVFLDRRVGHPQLTCAGRFHRGHVRNAGFRVQ